MGWETVDQNIVSYAYEGRIEERDRIWVQDTLPVKVEIFRRVDLETNLEKTKALVCTNRYIWGGVGWRIIQAQGYRGGGDIQGEEAFKVKLLRVWCESGGFILEGAHGESTWQNFTSDEGGGNWGGGQ